MNYIIKYLIENKLIAIILLTFFVSWGLLHQPFDMGLNTLPTSPVAVDAIPDIGENQQLIFTKWEGYTPQDIEDQITYPLTTALLGIPGVKTIRSSSMFGFSTIYVIFEEDVEFYWSRSRLLEKLNTLSTDLLPQGVTPTLGPDATGLGQVFWYTLEGVDQQGNTTGGWDLHELRTIQEYQIKNALASVSGVAEVASIGGFVQEYQIDVDPDQLEKYGINLNHVVKAVRETNRDVGAKTIEINQAEYLVRGLGAIKSLSDLENTVIHSKNYTSTILKDVAKIHLGPASRRGILDKEGAEAVGGVVIARYGANPMEVIANTKTKIQEISHGLPSKTLQDGTISQLRIVPFYDRSQLIQETLHTLQEALTMEILITILVIVLVLFNLRVSILISGLLPVAVLLVFVAMKFFDITANIVALSGIAIAIGTMVDLGVILSENILRHLDNSQKNEPINQIVYRATAEVSGAILTAVLTTIISFVPVFMLTGAEGKLFSPLAFTKTAALIAALFVSLFLMPPLAALFFKKRIIKKTTHYLWNALLLILGIITLAFGYILGMVFLVFGVVGLWLCFRESKKRNPNKVGESHSFWTKMSAHPEIIKSSIAVIALLVILANHWQPLGNEPSFILNFLFVSALCLGVVGFFSFFRKKYTQLLQWTLEHKAAFLLIPTTIIALGFWTWYNTEQEFMPTLDEGTFLLMPSSMPHAGIAENKRVLQALDKAVAAIPEIETVVGKAGRVASALDPAPLSMYENIIQYKPEYRIDNDGNRIRNWRSHIKTPDDIWSEIIKATELPGVTSAPKLQPIQTRLLMLQTGMRSPMGIKIKGQNLEQLAAFGTQLATLLRNVEGIKKETVFAERIIGKPYLTIDIDRTKLIQYGLRIETVQQRIEIAMGGKTLTHIIKGRERYAVRVRYPIALRSTPDAIGNITVPLKEGSIELRDLATIRYEKGPQVIKSEDTFLTSYVLFDKTPDIAEGTVITRTQKKLSAAITAGTLVIPKGVSYTFTGTYEHQLRATKTLSFIIPLALLTIFLILYLQFRSTAITFMVFAGIAVALAGGFIGIWCYEQSASTDINLSVAVWVGFIALFGIATDDGVLMATYLKQRFEKKLPQDKITIRKSVIEAGEKRIRPCLMTTATTLLALIPVMTSTGRGSAIMIPMAIPIFGGMLVALITLFVVPVLFCWKEEMKIRNN